MLKIMRFLGRTLLHTMCTVTKRVASKKDAIFCILVHHSLDFLDPSISDFAQEYGTETELFFLVDNLMMMNENKMSMLIILDLSTILSSSVPFSMRHTAECWVICLAHPLQQ